VWFDWEKQILNRCWTSSEFNDMSMELWNSKTKLNKRKKRNDVFLGYSDEESRNSSFNKLKILWLKESFLDSSSEDPEKTDLIAS
jgi:hypothetical protein